jgi:hypothetical protein
MHPERRKMCFRKHRVAELQDLVEFTLISILGIGLPIGLVGYGLRFYWFGLVCGLTQNQTRPTSSLKWT